METKKCKQCQTTFTITDDDRAFYDKVSPTFNWKKYLIPTPTLCPDCRMQQMLSFRNERNLFKTKCDLTWKDIISIHSPDKQYKVYDQKEYRWDNWNPLDYGMDVDFSVPVFQQLGLLFKKVPTMSLNAPMSQNSDFTNQCQKNKNCYMMFCSGSNEDCYLWMWNQDCKRSMDCLYLEFSEFCYEVVNGVNCYNCSFSQNLQNCSHILLSRDLINCQNCFWCVNLEGKQYHIFNTPYSKEEYAEKLNELKKNTRSWKTASDQFHALSLHQPHKFYNGNNNEKFSWDYLKNNHNAFFAFNCRDNEYTKYCRDTRRAKKTMDLVETLSIEFGLGLEGTSYCNNSIFCAKINEAHDLMYCSHCNFSNHLFGCIWLKNKEYCIFNKQYSKADYEKLVPKIMEKMEADGERGEYLPPSYSQFGYNETVAQEYFPLTKEEAIKQWFKRSDYEAPFPKTDAKDVIICEVSGKPFRLIQQEIEFYKKHNLPLPTKHPDVRHAERMKLRNPRKLRDRKCAKCWVDIQTTYAPERPEIVYCESCYNKEIY